MICPRCETQNREGLARCRQCGESLRLAPACPAVVAPPAPEWLYWAVMGMLLLGIILIAVPIHIRLEGNRSGELDYLGWYGGVLGVLGLMAYGGLMHAVAALRTPQVTLMVTLQVLALVVMGAEYTRRDIRPDPDTAQTCLSHQRKISIAILMTIEYDEAGVFPTEFERAARGEHVRPGTFACRGYREGEPITLGYGYNAHLAGRNYAEARPHVANLVLMADGKEPGMLMQDWTDIALERHTRGFHVTYADAHGEWIAAADIRTGKRTLLFEVPGTAPAPETPPAP